MTTSTIKRDSNHSSAMRQRADIKGYELYFDTAAKFGGEDSAPDPHDYLDAALIACKAIVIRIAAKRKNIPLTDVNITLNSDGSQERQGRYIMNVDIELVGDLTEEQRQILLEAAETCPIGKILNGEVKAEINSKLV